jgi:predicted metalloendopeptidase
LPAFTLSLAAAALLVACAGTPSAFRPAAPTSGVDLAAIDPGVRPQDDFYAHANGRWLKATTFPPDKAYIGAAEQIHDTTQQHLRTLVEEAQRRPADADARKIGELYASFMDEATVEQRGLAPLRAELAAIDAVTDGRGLAALMARLGAIGVGMPIGMYIGQDDRDATRYVPSLVQSGLGLPNRDYYLNLDDAKFAAVRDKYVEYLTTLLTLGGQHAAGAAAGARAILALETELARAQWSAVENRDPVKAYNRVALTDLAALAPGLDAPAYLAAAGLAGRTPDVLVRQPSYLTGLGRLVAATPLPTWKVYARAKLLGAYSPYLGRAFVDNRFAFAGTVLSGTTENRPRWKRGIALVDESIGEGLGRAYVARYFPPASKARMDAMVDNLRAAYRESIVTLDWMGPATRAQALAKLAKFNTKIGYPARWIDYATLEIRRDDLVGNVMRARRFEDTRQLAKLGQPIDRGEWQMNPQTVNAYYDASMNEIVFPAAYLQKPNFDPDADDAANYGAIGSVIGHEISHGFDDEGAQYDGDGNLRDWWTDADKTRFAAKTKALVAQYDAFVAVPPAYHVNGELTLGENIADNSGLAIAWKAWQRSLNGKPAPVIDGLTGAQRFFYGFAQAWRGKARDDALLALIKSDPHSPDEFRVLGTLRNHPAFDATFGLKPGDGMYLPPTERVSIW